MPPKKKTNLSKSSQQARESRARRDQEISEAAQERLSRQRSRSQTHTENESGEQRLKRLATKQAYSARVRQTESPESRRHRFLAMRTRSIELRNRESPHERQIGLTRQRERSACALLEETPQQQRIRRSRQRDRSALALSGEAPEQQYVRQARQRQRYQEARQAESTELRQQRLNAEKRATAASRQTESSEQRQQRLDADRRATAASRQTESSEQRQQRLDADRRATAASRQTESSEQRQQRLDADRRATAASRQTESSEQRQQRLDADRRATSASRQRRLDWNRAAFSYEPNLDYGHMAIISVGGMNVECKHCRALKFVGEPDGLCCSNGKVKLQELEKPPEPLNSLLSENKEFLDNIRKYNSCFQMTSFGCSKDATPRRWASTFKIQGQVYHRIGSVFPVTGAEPKFLQIYFMGDSDVECTQRYGVTQGLNRDIIHNLQDLLHTKNALVRSFKYTIQNTTMTDNAQIVISADKRPSGEHLRRFNDPSVNEVAVLLSNTEVGNRDIIIKGRDDNLLRISETHRSYDALQYPLMFWKGEDGYHLTIPQTNPETNHPVLNKKVSAADYYAYRLMKRVGDSNRILLYRDLLSQYLVDMYAKIEAERLLYIRLNQQKLRVDNYSHLRDAVLSDGDIRNVGELVILPSTYTGGPRDMHDQTQDAMAYVRSCGRPDLFITMTCNPKWEEITRELLGGQKPQHRHDIIARVFRQKIIKLKQLIKDSNIFGPMRCFFYTIEWQKRGLPHAHHLVWLKNRIHADVIDSIISAELPDPTHDSELFEIVKSHMIHVPCGLINPDSLCMDARKCTKKFPRSFVRRRHPDDGGISFKMKVGGTEQTVDNRWVVPYCPVLSKIFNSHINVELCNSVRSIKYICKYIHRGSDIAVFGSQANANDEITCYQMGRYISSNEAGWRLFKFPIHERYPTVVHLDVHLENLQRVYFTERTAEARAVAPKETKLTAFFALCKVDDFAQTILYPDVPKYFTWINNHWQRRKQGKPVKEHPNVYSTDAIGRVYTIHPNQLECFCLRLLLHVINGPTSYEDLKTINGATTTSFREACHKRGLLENDAQWNEALNEAVVTGSPFHIRNLFAIMLHFCQIADPMNLWLTYRESMSFDLLRKTKQLNPEATYSDAIFNQALIAIEDKLLEIGGKLLGEYGLPDVNRGTEAEALSRDILQETSYNRHEMENCLQDNIPKLNTEQWKVFDEVLHSVRKAAGGLIFLDAAGGTGKTFLLNLLLAQIRSDGSIALAVASSGIAATLLTGGRTAHSAFKLSLDKAKPKCSVSRGSGKAQLLRECKLIVWDECTMSHRTDFDSLDDLLRDLRSNNQPMGGITLLMAGDFRQILPVVPRGTIADELNASIKSSYLWRDVKSLKLETNMRVHLNDSNAAKFAEILLKIGNGKVSEDTDGMISLPCGENIDSIEELREKVFPNISENHKQMNWLSERAILAPRNVDVGEINIQILDLIPGDTRVYTSIDTMPDITDLVQYPTEFLNSLSPSGFPPHLLTLKVGSPIILLRNMDPPKLCNGTRLIIKTMQPNLLQAIIMTGPHSGEEVLIPRIPLIPTDTPVAFKRIQFPVKLCFSMTINKAQGQTLKVVGLHLDSPCFAHGQFYVGCSRVGTEGGLFFYAPKKTTKNVVYKEALR